MAGLGQRSDRLQLDFMVPDQHDPYGHAPALAFMTGASLHDDEAPFDSGNDTDMSSGYGDEFIHNSDVHDMTEDQAGPHIFMAYCMLRDATPIRE